MDGDLAFFYINIFSYSKNYISAAPNAREFSSAGSEHLPYKPQNIDLAFYKNI
jgi:hypothetical protein